jgi:hypothetical protein
MVLDQSAVTSEVIFIDGLSSSNNPDRNIGTGVEQD